MVIKTVFNPTKCNLKAEINAITDNYGCDVYIEVSGSGKSVQQGLDIITRLGRFVCFSVFNGDVEADWSLIGTVVEIWTCILKVLTPYPQSGSYTIKDYYEDYNDFFFFEILCCILQELIDMA